MQIRLPIIPEIFGCDYVRSKMLSNMALLILFSLLDGLIGVWSDMRLSPARG